MQMEQIGTDGWRRKIKTAAWLLVVSSTALSVVGAWQFEKGVPAIQFTTAISLMAALLNFVAVPFFLYGLKHFKNELRRAYILLSVGIIVFGIAQMQLPFISFFKMWFWSVYGFVAIPYLVAVVLIYLGVRSFARILHITSKWTALLVVTPAIIIISIAIAFLPHVRTSTPEDFFKLSVVLSMWDTLFMLAAAVVILKIKRTLGSLYANALAWLFAALLSLGLAGLHFTAILFFVAPGHWYDRYSLVIIPFVLGAMLFIRAGYAFNMIGTPPPEFVPEGSGDRLYLFFGYTPISSAGGVHTPLLDVTTYVIDMASNPDSIGVIIDEIRAITSGLEVGQSMRLEDERALTRVYLKLERYITTIDPLRKITQDELRHEIYLRFRHSDEDANSFWNRILTSDNNM